MMGSAQTKILQEEMKGAGQSAVYNEVINCETKSENVSRYLYERELNLWPHPGNDLPSFLSPFVP